MAKHSANNVDIIRQPKIMMLLTGYWPKRNESLSYRIKKHLGYTLTLVQTILMSMQLIANIEYVDRATDVFCLLATFASSYIKYIIFQYKRATFFKIDDQLVSGSFVDYSDRYVDHLKRNIRLSNVVAKMYQTACFAVISIYMLKPVFLHDERLPLDVPFDFPHVSLYYALYAFEILSLLITGWNNPCLDILSMGLMSVAAAQLDILCSKILHLNRFTEEELAKKETIASIERSVKDIVKHHVDIIRYVKNVEDVFCYCFLTQYIDSMLVTCATGFQVAHASSFQLILMGIFLFAALNQLSLYCWFGNDVIYNSENIRDACYQTNWYNYSFSVRKSLFIMMERSKRPLKLTAGKFSDLSLVSFMSILRTSYSYFAVVQHMYNNTLHNGNS